MEKPHLVEEVALHVVQSAFQRVGKLPTTTFKYAYGPVDHVMTYDALSFHPLGLGGLANDVKNTRHLRIGCGAAHREAVELCFAVSCCAGYAFRENRSFWLQALSLDSDGVAVLSIGRILYDFPPLDLSFSAESTDFVGGFFDLTSPRATRSEEFCLAMEMLKSYTIPERRAKPIQITLGFDSWDVTTMSSLLPSIPAAVDVAASGSGVHVEVGGLRFSLLTRNRESMLELFKCVPSGVEIRTIGSIGWPAGASTTVRVDESLAWKAMMGLSGTQWEGRLRELDVSGSRLDHGLAAACSLMPYSRSIQTLAVAAKSLADWLWLGYAMFHPHTHTTAWKKLKITATSAPTAAFDLLEVCVQANLWPLTEIEALSTRADPAAVRALRQRLQQTICEGQRTRRVQSASIRSKNAMLQLVTRGGEQWTRIPKRERVNICDTSEPSKASSNIVDVVVAGYGAGRVQTSSLKHLHASKCAGTWVSSILTLDVGGVSSKNVTRLAWLLAPRLEQLTVRGKSRNRSLAEVLLLPQSLKAVKGY